MDALRGHVPDAAAQRDTPGRLPTSRRAARGLRSHASISTGVLRKRGLLSRWDADILRALDALARDAASEQSDRLELISASAGEAMRLRDCVERFIVGDDDRRRLACLLHDTVLQLLEYVATDGYGAGLSRAELAQHLGQAAFDLRAAHRSRGLRPFDLIGALRTVVADAKRLGLPDATLDAGTMHHFLDREQAAELVGAAREALTNVRKHAGASNVAIRVRSIDGQTIVSVQDDGVGADPASVAAADGIGVRHSIVGRMARAGGTAQVETTPGGGTLVVLTVGSKNRGKQ
jgi:signal transduction histidine kinase